ncbi:Aste57867_19292 [Aphanomyces stellatus]|uniref:Aste57867_19292 protein n=1 Tax=Aphanomyces stellatus TaxID=120398 RepID=A0A485LCU3_9STRA|nr:hypothetical protein As57867_019228 [Aphanomyces stellatus]VFT96012.1 Aste57867_19292 [Aphanomyces stellatus]
MGRYAGTISILVLFVAVKFAVLSLVMPLWAKGPIDSLSHTTFVNSTLKAGVWGYCITGQVNRTPTDACIGFFLTNHTALREGRYQREASSHPFELVMATAKVHFAVDQGVCAAFRSGHFDIAGLDPNLFRQFLSNSCGTLGVVSFVASLLAMLLGLVALATLCGFVLCVEDASCFGEFVKAASVLAAFSSLVAIVSWLYQIDPLVHAGISRGIAFVLQVVACQLFVVAAIAVHAYANEKRGVNYNLTTLKSVEE